MRLSFQSSNPLHRDYNSISHSLKKQIEEVEVAVHNRAMKFLNDKEPFSSQIVVS